MPYIHHTLPEYPVKSDLWDYLASVSRPIVVYGMGNGADKLLDRLATYGVSVSDIFASDGFVRGHSFRGMRVKSFSEIKESYTDFIILLSFASSRTEVLKMLREIDREYEMYAPDMPVADTAEYFDREFYNLHYNEICAAYDALADERSRDTYASVINYKLTGKISYLFDCFDTTDELYSRLPCEKIRHYIDVGAYNGDTVRQAAVYFPNLSEVVAVEPDPKTYKRLLKYASGVSEFSLTTVNAAAFDEAGEGELMSAANRNSTVLATASYEHKTSTVPLVRVDTLAEHTDYIKYDVEGAESEALHGSHRLIEASHPTLLISLYHRSRDIFSLVNFVRERYPFYRLSLCRTLSVPAWEIALIATEK